MSAQLAPALSQRCHWEAQEVVSGIARLPGVGIGDWPTSAPGACADADFFACFRDAFQSWGTGVRRGAGSADRLSRYCKCRAHAFVFGDGDHRELYCMTYIVFGQDVGGFARFDNRVAFLTGRAATFPLVEVFDRARP